jgi:hypothetical protein
MFALGPIFNTARSRGYSEGVNLVQASWDCLEPIEKQSLLKRCDAARRIEWLTELDGETA